MDLNFYYVITHKFDSKRKCFIYLFGCRTCGKQYTVKANDRLRYSWNNFKMEAGNAESGDMENCKQKFSRSHFLQDNHKGFLEEANLRLIDKTLGSDPTERKCHWMRSLKTLYRDGLNIESDY